MYADFQSPQTLRFLVGNSNARSLEGEPELDIRPGRPRGRMYEKSWLMTRRKLVEIGVLLTGLRVTRGLRDHWPEYLLEASGLAVIMLVSSGITVFAQTLLPDGWTALPRRMVEGMAIGSTAIGLVYSPWGLRSGAHYNPAVTLTFLILGRVNLVDAAFYVIFQFAGAFIGIFLSGFILGSLFQEPPTMWIVTRPGEYGVFVAFLAEFAIAFLAMETILITAGLPHLSRFTGIFVGVLIFLFVSFESPLSGFSMNPARSFGSAAAAGYWRAFWIYVLVPPTGMLVAAFLNRSISTWPSTNCAKLAANCSHRCIHCGFTPAKDSELVASVERRPQTEVSTADPRTRFSLQARSLCNRQ
jgi:aquaporin Z